MKTTGFARVSEEIVEKLQAAIREGRLAPGDRLPSERELTEQFGVSRVSLRDALRVLEAKGLIEVRVGARGGAFVTAPAPQLVGEGMATMLALSSVSASEVTEARRIFELGMLTLACERATDEDLDELDAICKRSAAAVQAGDFDVGFSTEFHVALARCAHNRALEVIVESFRGPILMSLARAREAAPEMGVLGVEEHTAVAQALRDRDAVRAQEVLARHLARTAERLHGARPGGAQAEATEKGDDGRPARR